TDSASRPASPEDLFSRAERTWPDRFIVKATKAVPFAALPGGKRLWRLRWASSAPFQLAGAALARADEATEGSAAVGLGRAAEELSGAGAWPTLVRSGPAGFCGAGLFCRGVFVGLLAGGEGAPARPPHRPS